MCHKKKWLEFLEWAKHKRNAYFLGMGDYDDFVSSSERKILTNRDLHDTTLQTFDKLYLMHTKRFYDEIKFMDGKLIGLIEGNHYGEFQNQTTTTQKLAELLKCKYLGVSAFIRLSFHYSTHHFHTDIWAHHGKGAARLIGGSLNRVQQMGEAAEADIYLMGHDHKKSVGLVTKLKLGDGTGRERQEVKLHHKKQLYARTGSFLKGYEAEQVSYVADMALSPTDLGVVKIELTPRHIDKSENKKRIADYYYCDIHASI
jgi:hypothetical protein